MSFQYTLRKFSNNNVTPDGSPEDDQGYGTLEIPKRMAFRVRSSKFRHVFGSAAKKEHCYECVKITKNAHDSNFCAVNPKFIAIVTESAGGGAFVVLPIERTGRIDINSPRVCGHAGPVLDIKWNPFNDHVIASCSDDTTIKLWQVPEGGLKANLTEWIVDLHGHQRRVGYIEWHPTAENILLSAAYDFKCILWNTETAEPVNIISVHPDTIFSIAWNRDGSLFATTCKDKKIRVIEPRQGTVVAEGVGHQGSKAAKVVFLGDKNRIFTAGFSRMSERQYGIWDYSNLSKPLKMDNIDSSSGVLIPFYDHDTKVIFVAGKGDGNIRYYETVDEPPYCHYLSQYQSGSPQRGLGIMPKRGIDPNRCEIVRFYKLHTIKGICEPISMIVPRKSEMFQEDIFPPASSACPSLTADEWISGQNREPILISLKLTESKGAAPTNSRTTGLQTRSSPKVSTKTITISQVRRPSSRKDGALSKGPTITTYRAVKRSPSASDSPSHKRTSPGAKSTTPPIAPEQMPLSLRNIKKLSSAGDGLQERTGPSMNLNEIISPSDNRRNVSITSPATRLSNANTPITVDKKVWSSSYHSSTNQIPPAESTPKTDPELQSPTWTYGSQPVATPVAQTSPGDLTDLSSTYLSCPPSEVKALVRAAHGTPKRNLRQNRDSQESSSLTDTPDVFTTPPSSPKFPISKSPVSTLSIDKSGNAPWSRNPLYTNNDMLSPAPNYRSVDTTQLDDILKDFAKSPGRASSYPSLIQEPPSLSPSYGKETLASPTAQTTSPTSPTVSQMLFVPHQNGTEQTGVYPPPIQRTTSDICIAHLNHSTKPDKDDDELLECLSSDAPDDTLIKPSKLRESMRSRKKRESFKKPIPEMAAEAVAQQPDILSHPAKSQNIPTQPTHTKSTYGVNYRSESSPDGDDVKPQKSPTQSTHSKSNYGVNWRSETSPDSGDAAKSQKISTYPTHIKSNYGVNWRPDTSPDSGDAAKTPKLPAQPTYSKSNYGVNWRPDTSLDSVDPAKSKKMATHSKSNYGDSWPSETSPESMVNKINMNGGMGDYKSNKTIVFQDPASSKFTSPKDDKSFLSASENTGSKQKENTPPRLLFNYNDEQKPHTQKPTYKFVVDPPETSPGSSKQRESARRRKLQQPSEEVVIFDEQSKVHVKKVWSPMQQSSSDMAFANGMPNTDAELRKAYFRQVEEIKSLTDQVRLKDKRIRQLEEEMRLWRSGESNC